MNIIKKASIALIAVFILSMGLSYFGLDGANVAEASLKSTVKSNSTEDLTETVDNAGQEIVKLGRDIGIVLLVVMIGWMGYSLVIKKSAEGLADMKGRMVGVIIAVALIFFSEQILGAIFGIFGYKI